VVEREGDGHQQGALDQLASDHDAAQVEAVADRPGQRPEQRRCEVAHQQQHRHGQRLTGRVRHVHHQRDKAE
jgi:hypothetical protein